jgi:hypothetical protein
MMDAVKQLAENHHDWKKDYTIDYVLGNINHIDTRTALELTDDVNKCFSQNFA